MTEREAAELLRDGIHEYAETYGTELRDTRTFAEDGVLTQNVGFTVRFWDRDDEFQVTIVKSR